MPVCWMIAGPNGAGKTTFALEYLPAVAHCKNFKWLLTNPRLFFTLAVSYWVFKTVDSKDAVVKATRKYSRRVLKAQ